MDNNKGEKMVVTTEAPVPEEEQAPGQVLGDLIVQLEDYIPTVPDEISAKYLNAAGFEATDPRIIRLMSVAAQKFISDIANDSLQHCKTRTSNTQHSSGHGSSKVSIVQKPSKDRKYTLAMEDLTPALADYGITVRKPQYFV